ncbi:MAG: NirD/YgiW/YdeI family stress tolerance protein [Treponema sp.]|jgi:uncharacterized protein (TIGR00156 family)|nr:NirD/YgiW/YdeI family stress tolerance protein [Treponema sp.]
MEDNTNKKQLILLVCLTVSVTFAAYAQQGGYKGPGTTPVTVEEAQTLPNPAFVILQGKIERRMLPTQYIFSDDTGKISLNIPDRIWGDISVDENDTVEIRGIINKASRREWGTTHLVAVESIRKQ